MKIIIPQVAVSLVMLGLPQRRRLGKPYGHAASEWAKKGVGGVSQWLASVKDDAWEYDPARQGLAEAIVGADQEK